MKTRENPFKELYIACNSRNKDNIPEFPYMVDIELTNFCTHQCVMCPGQTISTRRKGYMKPEVWYKLLDELKDKVEGIRFVRWGEPTLYPLFTECVRSAKAAGLKVHVNTNGRDTRLLRGVDSVKFSFQGVDSVSYYLARGKAFYNELVMKISDLYRQTPRPYIEIGTTIEDGEEAMGFIRQMEGISDHVSVGRTVKFGEKNPGLTRVTDCHEVYSKLSVNWDGLVSACCADYDNLMVVGDFHFETLEEIWNGAPLAAIRDMVENGGSSTHPLCRDCYQYTKKEEKR